MSRMRDVQSKKRGAALALALFAVVILLLTGMGLLRFGLQARVYAARTSDEIAARTAADAGLERAIAEMNAALSAGESDSSSLSKPKDDQPLPNSDATYTYKIVANSINSSGDFNITCTGRSGIAQKTLGAKVTLSGPFDYGIFVDGDINLKPGTTVDGYNSDIDRNNMNLPVKVGTNSTAGGAVSMLSGTLVKGDVAVGPGGDPDVVISAPDGAITGETYALSEEKEMPSVKVPNELASMAAKATLSEPAVITGQVKYEGINLGTGESLTIDGPTTLYVTGDIGLMNSAQIKINEENPEACLTLYLGGNLYMKNGGMINNSTQDPKKMQIYGLDSCTNMSLATAGIFYGAMYTPKATVNIKSALEIYGSIVAAGLNQGSTSNIHYDESLKDQGAEVASTGFSIVRWWEN